MSRPASPRKSAAGKSSIPTSSPNTAGVYVSTAFLPFHAFQSYKTYLTEEDWTCKEAEYENYLATEDTQIGMFVICRRSEQIRREF